MSEYYNKVSTIRVSVGVSSILDREGQCPGVSTTRAQDSGVLLPTGELEAA